MEIREHILTNNDCYKAGRTIVPQGIMVHSTGTAQPDVEVFLRQWDRPGVEACAHAFVHQGGVVETLPWNWRGWHAGSPPDGGISANNTHISFEILEPAGHTYQGGVMAGYDAAGNAPYFTRVYRNAVELCAFLCRLYGFDPKRDIVDHHEGCLRDIASNHADVSHWFPKHNKSMDTLRADVAALLAGAPEEEGSMTQAEFNTMFATALAAWQQDQQRKSASSWAQEAWKKAKEAGLFDGSAPQAPMTREQAALVFQRMGLMK